jgi:hypothetical protein
MALNWPGIVGTDGWGEKYRLAMLRLGATDADFDACGITPPTSAERAQAKAEGWRVTN